MLAAENELRKWGILNPHWALYLATSAFKARQLGDKIQTGLCYFGGVIFQTIIVPLTL